MAASARTIRQATPDDYNQIITVLNGWWGGRSMITMLPRLFFEQLQPWAYVAEIDGEVAGFVSAFRSQANCQQAYCHFIGVDPASRGQGIGEALYQRLFADAGAVGCIEILAVTSPENRGSIAFHQRMGFSMLPGPATEDGIPFTANYDGPGEHRVRLRKTLPTRRT